MPSTFARPVNDLKTTTTGHAAGASSLALAAGAGALLGALPSGRIFRVTALQAPETTSEVILGVFEATGISGDTLTGVTGAEGFSNVALAAGAAIQVRMTAQDYEDHSTAINAAEASIASLQANASTDEAAIASNAAAIALRAPLASPTFTGTPAAPTAAVGTGTTQLATTAFVLANAGGGMAIGGAVSGGTAGRVPYEATGPVLADSAGLTFDGTTLAIDYTATGAYYEGVRVHGHGASLYLHDTDGTRDPIRLSNAFGQLFIFNDTSASTLAACTAGGHWAFGSANASSTVTVLVSPPLATSYGLVIQGASGQSAPLLPLRGISSTSAARDLGYLDAGFSAPTDATYTGWVSLSSQDHNGTAHEGLRVDSDGTKALVTLSGQVAIGTLSGLLKGTSGVVSTAVAGTDYLTPTGNGSALTGLTGSQITGNIAGNAASITGSITESQVTGLTSDLALKAPLASPTFTGTPASPTAAGGTNTTQVATTAFVHGEIAALSLGTIATQAASAVAITGGTLTGVTITSHGGSYATSSSGAFDCATSDWFTRTLDGTNGTISLSNVQSRQQVAVELVQDGTGGRAVTYSGMTVVWMTSGGVAPTIAAGAGLITTLLFKQISTGNYRGWLTGSQA